MFISFLLFCSFLTFVTSLEQSSWYNCTPGWTYQQEFGACYGASLAGFNDIWEKAEKYCQGLNSHLPSIHSYQEFQFLSSYVTTTNDNIWTGIYTEDNGKTFKTTDGSEVDFLKSSNWCSAFTGTPGKRCIAIGYAYGDFCFFDNDCGVTKAHTVCKSAIECLDQNGNSQISSNEPWMSNSCSKMNTCWRGKKVSRIIRCDPQERCLNKLNGKSSCQSTKCPADWRYFNGSNSCYKAIYNVTFDQAKKQCLALDSNLTSIHTLEEDYFITDAFQIGTTDASLHEQSIIGYERDWPVTKVYWLDGTPMDFNFGMAYPNSLNISKPVHLALYSDNATPRYGYLQGMWYFIDDELPQRLAVCKKPAY